MVHAAPPIHGWKIVAFKQPASDISIPIGNLKLNGSTVKVVYESGPNRMFDISVYVPAGPDQSADDLAKNGFFILDHVIGEYATMTRIAGIEFKPASSVPSNAITLASFAKLLSKPNH